MIRIALVLLPIAAPGAASCGKPATPDGAPGLGNRPATAAHAPGARATATPGEADADADAGTTMRYSCKQGHPVAIVRGGIARVALADGRVVDIPRVADSAPPRYSGVALSFEVGSDGATLGQHEVGGFACHEAG